MVMVRRADGVRSEASARLDVGSISGGARHWY